MKVYAFDVDETLDISGGPIPLSRVAELRDAGHIVGICGNFAVVTLQVPTWASLFSFIGPMAMTKADFLRQISTYVPADSGADSPGAPLEIDLLHRSARARGPLAADLA